MILSLGAEVVETDRGRTEGRNDCEGAITRGTTRRPAGSSRYELLWVGAVDAAPLLRPRIIGVVDVSLVRGVRGVGPVALDLPETVRPKLNGAQSELPRA